MTGADAVKVDAGDYVKAAYDLRSFHVVIVAYFDSISPTVIQSTANADLGS